VDKNNEKRRDDVYSKKVRAGKRTYFLDVKATRGDDYYITITESKKKPKADGEGFFYEKHKIFLYKEDFIKFLNALDDCVTHISEELMPDFDFEQFAQEDEDDDDDFEEYSLK